MHFVTIVAAAVTRCVWGPQGAGSAPGAALDRALRLAQGACASPNVNSTVWGSLYRSCRVMRRMQSWPGRLWVQQVTAHRPLPILPIPKLAGEANPTHIFTILVFTFSRSENWVTFRDSPYQPSIDQLASTGIEPQRQVTPDHPSPVTAGNKLLLLLLLDV